MVIKSICRVLKKCTGWRLDRLDRHSRPLNTSIYLNNRCFMQKLSLSSALDQVRLSSYVK